MPVYNAPLLAIDAKETRRYAGLQKAATFDEEKILAACEDARLLAAPKGIWTVYDYDCQSQQIQAAHPCKIKGKKIAQHLNGCEKVIILAATVGEAIEAAVTRRFNEGEYSNAVIMDAAATAAVEQLADGMEKAIAPQMAAQGYLMKWRFSPGYGDWPLEQQPDLVRLAQANKINIHLSTSLMLIPRKSITAIIGLYRKQEGAIPNNKHGGCAHCQQKDCPSRKINSPQNRS
ncbi:MAG: methionine synthase [Selenomonas sp.]|uniref:methionine synthase n=1 Tax=Selenomonas sp. TaxID=2053611 RepID=UPI0025E31A53|nr:methionine synthase [Selenomonas sp.]MCR5758306.1 methionine synthase [Selenomonas sp.]